MTAPHPHRRISTAPACGHVDRATGRTCTAPQYHVTGHRYPALPQCEIQGAHCEQCGSTDYEDLHCGDQGYTACCNECISYGPADCRGHHVR